MKKSGLADSPFFTRPGSSGKGSTPPSGRRPAKKEDLQGEKAVYQSHSESVDDAMNRPNEPSTNRPTDQLVDQSTDRPTNRSIDQSTRLSSSRSTEALADVDTLGLLVERPRAFYITAEVDRWLNEAVRYLKEKGLHKVDRSVLVNALLHDPDHYNPSSLDKMRARLLAHLTNKSLKRMQSTE